MLTYTSKANVPNSGKWAENNFRQPSSAENGAAYDRCRLFVGIRVFRLHSDQLPDVSLESGISC